MRRLKREVLDKIKTTGGYKKWKYSLAGVSQRISSWVPKTDISPTPWKELFEYSSDSNTREALGQLIKIFNDWENLSKKNGDPVNTNFSEEEKEKNEKWSFARLLSSSKTIAKGGQGSDSNKAGRWVEMARRRSYPGKPIVKGQSSPRKLDCGCIATLIKVGIWLRHVIVDAPSIRRNMTGESRRD